MFFYVYKQLSVFHFKSSVSSVSSVLSNCAFFNHNMVDENTEYHEEGDYNIRGFWDYISLKTNRYTPPADLWTYLEENDIILDDIPDGVEIPDDLLKQKQTRDMRKNDEKFWNYICCKIRRFTPPKNLIKYLLDNDLDFSDMSKDIWIPVEVLNSTKPFHSSLIKKRNEFNLNLNLGGMQPQPSTSNETCSVMLTESPFSPLQLESVILTESPFSPLQLEMIPSQPSTSNETCSVMLTEPPSSSLRLEMIPPQRPILNDPTDLFCQEMMWMSPPPPTLLPINTPHSSIICKYCGVIFCFCKWSLEWHRSHRQEAHLLRCYEK
ncbi:uncharacterized protein isoform X3 [Leptinotarsa decemlineata]|uniref:uncharacterized protein isoform X3 n=1 Tax=Leptinotarsa decemlineata TaxID=7539 RepID=UPI003D30CF9F